LNWPPLMLEREPLATLWLPPVTLAFWPDIALLSPATIPPKDE
jgi:hypothetical protein